MTRIRPDRFEFIRFDPFAIQWRAMTHLSRIAILLAFVRPADAIAPRTALASRCAARSRWIRSAIRARSFFNFFRRNANNGTNANNGRVQYSENVGNSRENCHGYGVLDPSRFGVSVLISGLAATWDPSNGSGGKGTGGQRGGRRESLNDTCAFKDARLPTPLNLAAIF